ncbi:uncharacterized protein TNCV_1404231 [Trichonephila clavipes]|nr:uncharacterized protein TNCV_1404231 [Trichonephila clavipes]
MSNGEIEGKEDLRDCRVLLKATPGWIWKWRLNLEIYLWLLRPVSDAKKGFGLRSQSEATGGLLAVDLARREEGHPVGVMWKLGEEDISSGVVLSSLDHHSKLRVERRLSERLLYEESNIRTSFFLSTTCTVNENVWSKPWPDLEGEKNFNDNHGKINTAFVQSIPGFQECDDVETWMACDVEDCGFQMLDDEIVTYVQEEPKPVDDETDEDEGNNNNESSKGP